MRKSLARIGVLTGRNLKEILRDPISLVFAIVMPLVLEILFYLIFHDLTQQFEMRYLAPGIVVFAQSFLALFVGLLLATDRSTSFLTRLYVSKARSYEFIISYAIAIVPIVLIQSVLFFVVGGLFDHAIFTVGMLFAVLLGLVTSLFFIATGLLLGCVCNEKSVGGICSIVIAGQSVLSGMWFPLDGLNKGMLTFMKVLPFRNATMAIQNALNGIGNAVDDLIVPIAIVLAYTLVVFVVAILIFKLKMRSK